MPPQHSKLMKTPSKINLRDGTVGIFCLLDKILTYQNLSKDLKFSIFLVCCIYIYYPIDKRQNNNPVYGGQVTLTVTL